MIGKSPGRADTTRLIQRSFIRAGHGARPVLGRAKTIALLAVAFLLAAGCASNEEHHPQPKPGSGILEHKEIALKAQSAMGSALTTLDNLRAQPAPCPTNVLEAFATQVNRLQVDSVQIRAKSQAIHERGDAYFANWHENIAQVKDSEMRARAESLRPQLEEHFQRIKEHSKEGHTSFKVFISEMRDIRNALELDAQAIAHVPTRGLIDKALQDGREIQRNIQGILHELNAMQAMLNLPSNHSK